MINEISGVMGPIFGRTIPLPKDDGGLRPRSGAPEPERPEVELAPAVAATGIGLVFACAFAEAGAADATGATDAEAAAGRPVVGAEPCWRASWVFCCCNVVIFCSSELIRFSYNTRMA